MGKLWGPATEIKDLGVVAEQCPYCERIAPCFVRAIWQVDYVLFVKTSVVNKDTSCLCPTCAGSFPCKLWCYPELATVKEAAALPLDDLLARTNPRLVERNQMRQQVRALGGDARFTAAFEQLDGMRPGEMQVELLKQLFDWCRLKDEQRDHLVQRVADCARAWQLLRQVGPWFPSHGCLSAIGAGLVVWSAFLWSPVGQSWLGIVGTVLAGLGAAALTSHLFLARRIRRWTRLVLVPEAKLANVSLPTFLTVVDDLTGAPVNVMDDLWPVKDQIETIRGVLARDGKL
jgi:hypothetical protein